MSDVCYLWKPWEDDALKALQDSMARFKQYSAAQEMCLAPHVCKAIYRSEPLPIGYYPQP